MGYNSYNTWSAEITDQIIRDNARAMVNSGLANRGWTHTNLDEGWGGVRGGRLNAVRGEREIPDMKVLYDYVHGLGLKMSADRNG